MKPVMLRAEMRAYDKFAIESCHVPGVVLMESAGRGAAAIIAGLRGDEANPRALIPSGTPPANRVVIVCGAGNNGGDGFVVARHLATRGFEVHCFLTAPTEKIVGDARINLDAYVDLGGRVLALANDADLPAFQAELERAPLVVDAIFGTGLTRPVEGFLRDVIDRVNAAPGRRVALDIPSGLDADTGKPLGVAVQADETITFGCFKLGLLVSDGAKLCGRVHVVDLGVPPVVLEKIGHFAEIIESRDVAGWIAPRDVNAHKHAAGNVLCVAGSRGKLGAAVLVGRAALRAGAGLVTVASWPEAVDVFELRVVELMSARIDRADITGSLDEALSGKKAVVVGPGLGLDQNAKCAVEHLILHGAGTTIFDADALTLFAGRPEAFAVAGGDVILTPHPGEAARLLGTTTTAVEQDRVGAVRALAQRARATVVLKGARTLIADREGVLTINTSGNTVLATAGSGDVLAGIIAAFACVMPPKRAARAAAHVHGLAGDKWRVEHGGADRGLLASELGDLLPAVLAALAKEGDALPV